LSPSEANRNGIAGFPFAGNVAVAKAGFIFPGVGRLLNLDAEATANGVFAPESGLEYETGVKLSTQDGRFVLTTAAFNSFFPTMVQGRGWVCIALVVFASWLPARALGGAFLFAFCDAFQLRLQHVIGKAVPYQVFLMLPYLISILALLLVARRARVPQALMTPYRRGER